MKRKELVDGKVLAQGRIIHFINEKGKQYPMLMIEYRKHPEGKHAPLTCGAVFTEAGVEYQENIPYDVRRSPNSWHWPENNITAKKNAAKGPQLGKPLVSPEKIKAGVGK